MTKRELCESILIQLNGGQPNDESPWTLRQVLHHVNSVIAIMARKSAFENHNLGGVAYADDSFNVTFKKLALKRDGSNRQHYLDVPGSPVGIPMGRGLVRVVPSRSFKNINIKIISKREAARFYGLPEVPGMIFCYYDDKGIRFVGCQMITEKEFDVTMVSAGTGGMNDEMSIPEDAVFEIEGMVLERVRGYGPKDVIDDGEHFVSNTIN